MTGMLTGSFDPITGGHMDLIRRAVAFCDTLVIAMLVNVDKEYFFSVEDRLSFINTCISDIPNAKAVFSDGFACDIATEMSVDFFIRGIRNGEDFEYERQVAKVYKEMSGIDTLFLIATDDTANISSTNIRNALKQGNDITGLVPEIIKQKIRLE